MAESDPSSWCPTPPDVPNSGQDRRQPAFCLAGSLAHTGFRPYLLTGMLRQLLLQHFANADNIEEPDLKELIWQEAQGTGILVESVWRWRADTIEKRPAILLKQNAYRNFRVLINDRYGSDARGFEHYVTTWVGSHTVMVIHASGAAASVLATEVQRDLTQWFVVLGPYHGLLRLQVTEVGAVSEVEESSQHYVVPIVVGWAYEEKWSVRPDALPLQTVAMTITTDDF